RGDGARQGHQNRQGDVPLVRRHVPQQAAHLPPVERLFDSPVVGVDEALPHVPDGLLLHGSATSRGSRALLAAVPVPPRRPAPSWPAAPPLWPARAPASRRTLSKSLNWTS